MYFTQFNSFWDDLLDPLKVTFDGDNKYIYINPQYTTVRAKEDIYSASKRWLQRRQNFEFAQPLRSIGGDSVGGGLYAGDIYFLTNSWLIVVDHQITITGIIYNDNTGVSPYVVQAGGGVIATVSSLAYAYSTSGVTVPSAQEVASTVWAQSPTTWSANTNTIGGQINNINTTTQNTLAVTI